MGDDMTDATNVKTVLKVGNGRGFVIEADDRRLIVTAAHCLPKLPPRASISHASERTYQNLLGAIGKRRKIWAECLFVDPVADIAVLGSPDDQESSDKADAYNQLVEVAIPLRVSQLHDGTLKAWLIPLHGASFSCEVEVFGRALWIENPTQKVKGGMSGSPILAEDGSAVGVVVTPHGPNPGLTSHLPGWLLGEIDIAAYRRW
jgi:Trypsin-like peptidase domain